MNIEELGVSEECRDKLRSGGIDNVDDIVDFFQYVFRNATFTISWGGECFDEVVDKLKLMGLLPEDF
ncbi:MAG: hypothetical protein H0X30_01490 [Anaerolineae bacterium]|nr:hypothetical protein [Anaerolineae bacterium]